MRSTGPAPRRRAHRSLCDRGRMVAADPAVSPAEQIRLGVVGPPRRRFLRRCGAGGARTHDLTDLRSTALAGSAGISGHTLQRVEQVLRDQAGWQCLLVVGCKRGAFRGPS